MTDGSNIYLLQGQTFPTQLINPTKRIHICTGRYLCTYIVLLKFLFTSFIIYPFYPSQVISQSQNIWPYLSLWKYVFYLEKPFIDKPTTFIHHIESIFLYDPCTFPTNLCHLNPSTSNGRKKRRRDKRKRKRMSLKRRRRRRSSSRVLKTGETWLEKCI